VQTIWIKGRADVGAAFGVGSDMARRADLP
jgi:hypothetical protein